MNNETLRQLKAEHSLGAQAEEEALLQGEEVQVHDVVYEAIPDMTKKAAMETKGSAGPSGMDANS